MAYKTNFVRTGTTGYYINAKDRDYIEEKASWFANETVVSKKDDKLEWDLVNNSFQPLALEQMLMVPSTITGAGPTGKMTSGHTSFGWDVDICNGYAIVGSPEDSWNDYPDDKIGAAYIYDLSRKPNVTYPVNPGTTSISNSNLIKVVRPNGAQSGVDYHYGRSVACGFGKFAVAGGQTYTSTGNQSQFIDIWSAASKLDDVNGTAVSDLAYTRIVQPTTLPYTDQFGNNWDLDVWNFASGMTIADNALYVTADVQKYTSGGTAPTPSEGNLWYSMLMVYSLNSGELLNYSVPMYHRNQKLSTDGHEALVSSIPPLTGGNYNDTGVWEPTYGGGGIDLQTYQGRQSQFNDWKFPNNRIAAGSDRIIVGAPMYGRNSDDLNQTVKVGVGQAYVFDMNGNFMYECFDEPQNAFANLEFRGATVTAGMGVVGASGSSDIPNQDDHLEFLFFSAETNYRHVILPMTGRQKEDPDLAILRSGGRVVTSFPSTTSYTDGRNASMIVAGGVRFIVTGTDADDPRARISIMDEDFFPFLTAATSDPNAAILRNFSSSILPDELYNAVRKGFFGKMKYSNGKMISSSNIISSGSPVSKEVPIFQWPMRTHILDMMEHMR